MNLSLTHIYTHTHTCERICMSLYPISLSPLSIYLSIYLATLSPPPPSSLPMPIIASIFAHTDNDTHTHNTCTHTHTHTHTHAHTHTDAAESGVRKHRTIRYLDSLELQEKQVCPCMQHIKPYCVRIVHSVILKRSFFVALSCFSSVCIALVLPLVQCVML